MPKILTEPGAKEAKYTTRAIAEVSHPIAGKVKIDVVVINNACPIGQRIRDLVSEYLGADWDGEWRPTGDCF